MSQSLPVTDGGGGTGSFQSIPVHLEARASWDHWELPFKASEQLQGHKGRRTMPFGRWQKLPRGKRKVGSDAKPEMENIFSELGKGSVLFCLEAADGLNIPVLPNYFLGHRPF